MLRRPVPLAVVRSFATRQQELPKHFSRKQGSTPYGTYFRRRPLLLRGDQKLDLVLLSPNPVK